MLLSLFMLTALSAHAEPRPIFRRAAALLEDRYLWLDRVDARKAFVSAAEEVERAVPWLIVIPTDDGVRLRDARSGAEEVVSFTPSDDDQGLDQLVDGLGLLASLIEGFGGPLPEDVDVAVELAQGVARSLDKHTVVMAKSRLKRFDERIKGKLTGIGAKLRMEEGVLRADVVFEDTPAERGGLQPEDAILRVDGVATLGMSLQQAVNRIRGPKDAEVVLSVQRRQPDGSDADMELVFVRDEVNIPNVEWELGEDGVGIIQISHFSDHTARLTSKALAEFARLAEAGQPFSGVVLDLRSNTGGSLIQSAETVDLFVDSGEIVRTDGRDGAAVPNLVRSLKAHASTAAHEEPEVPLVVLQNQRSASASEIVAGALAALDRAVVIGRTSYGKGTVQKLYTLRGGEDRVRMKATVAEYKLHGGVEVHDTGIPTDLTMRRVVFNGSGAWIPPDRGGIVPLLVEVDERVGWRTEGEFEKNADPLLKFARRLALSTVGPTRQDGLEAIARLAEAAKADADARLAETFMLRNIDWRPADEQPGVLDAAVSLEMEGDATAGERVRLNAEVRNDGPAPLYRVRVRLRTDSKSAWRGATIPIGFVPPGETARGTVEVAVGATSPSRSDDVHIVLEADALDPLKLDPVVFDIADIPTPPLGATARLVPHGDHHRMEVELENRGEVNLTGMRLKLAWRDDSGIELIDREAILPVLGAGDSGRFDLEVRLLEGAPAEGVPVELRVGADRFPSLLTMPISVPVDGQDATLAAPFVDAQTPTRSEEERLIVPLTATDDGRVESMVVWWNGEKLAWIPGGDSSVSAEVEVLLEPGQNTLTVIAEDDGGLEASAHRMIWGAVRAEVALDE